MKNGTKEHPRRLDHSGLRHPTQLIFKIVIIHENLSTALRAKELADRLSAAFNFEITTDLDFWKFDWLNWSPFREQAADAATRADLVILSATNNEMPSLGLQTWIDSWLPEKKGQWSAVVTLVGGGRCVPAGVRQFSSYVQDLATKAKVDFFTNVADEPEPARSHVRASAPWSAPNRLQLRPEPLNVSAIVERSHSHYQS